MRCDSPEVIRGRGADRSNQLLIRCGVCLSCQANWRKGWVLRMLLEAQSNEHALFLTLTYADGAVPLSLPYADVSGFLKRLRTNSRRAVRFFCAGEFGETYNRPHWHLILFAPEPLEMPVGLCSLKEWRYGGAMVAPASPATMAYTAGYSLKKRLTEVCIRMSRRPGLGLVRAFEIARELHRQMPVAPVFPYAMRVGQYLYPMDRYLRDTMKDAYLWHGGKIQCEERSDLSLTTESILEVKQGRYMIGRARVGDMLNKEHLAMMEKSYGKAS